MIAARRQFWKIVGGIMGLDSLPDSIHGCIKRVATKVQVGELDVLLVMPLIHGTATGLKLSKKCIVVGHGANPNPGTLKTQALLIGEECGP